MNTSVDSTPAFIEATYKKMEINIATICKRLGRALTYGERFSMDIWITQLMLSWFPAYPMSKPDQTA